jgi:SRSO17 transposase
LSYEPATVAAGSYDHEVDGALSSASFVVMAAGGREPTDYWLATLPETTPLPELVRLGKIRWRIEHDYCELRTGLGLDHCEGRTWPGWHRHVTLVTAAQLFLTLFRTSPTAATPA